MSTQSTAFGNLGAVFVHVEKRGDQTYRWSIEVCNRNETCTLGDENGYPDEPTARYAALESLQEMIDQLQTLCRDFA